MYCLQRTRVVYQEEMFDIMFEAHVIGVNHPTWKTVQEFLRQKYSNNISGSFCDLFQEICTTCSLKKRVALNQEVVQPIISEGIMHRWQIDLINMQV